MSRWYVRVLAVGACWWCDRCPGCPSCDSSRPLGRRHLSYTVPPKGCPVVQYGAAKG